MSHITEWLRRLRINDKYKPSFTTMNSKKDSSNVDISMYIPMVTIIYIVAAPVKPQYCTKRLLSWRVLKKSVKSGQLIQRPVGGTII